MKKTIYALTAALLISTLIPTAVSAHGHGGYRRVASNQRYYTVCNVEDCEITRTHRHNGVNYYGHYYEDGHGYHDSFGHTGGWHH